MLSNITLGQFFPGESIIHKTDPRVKIVLMLVLLVSVFLASNYVSLFILLLTVILLVILSRISINIYFRSMKFILYIILFTSILNIFYGKGVPILELGPIVITEEGLNNSIFVSLRLIMLILISSLLTFTTTPTDLTDALERIMKPLTVFKIKTHELAMMMTIALRFVPTLLEETDKIMNAQKARGADMESGNILKRIKSLIPILVPLFVSSFRRAYDLAMAMECRCYRGGLGRTRMKVLHVKMIDIIAIILIVLVCFMVIFSNMYFRAVN